MWCDQEDAAGPSDPQAPGAGKGKAGSAKEITARPTASPRLVELVQVKSTEGIDHTSPKSVGGGWRLALSVCVSLPLAR